MPQIATAPETAFDDRRQYAPTSPAPLVERRQFSNSYDCLSPAARELATAIDEYKIRHRRRFITYEEMMGVIESLGYARS